MEEKPIVISEELAAKYADVGQFEKFDAAVRKILTVPRAELLRREERQKKKSALNPKRRGPKPKGASRAPVA
jgi:hypothetical protein